MTPMSNHELTVFIGTLLDLISAHGEVAGAERTLRAALHGYLEGKIQSLGDTVRRIEARSEAEFRHIRTMQKEMRAEMMDTRMGRP